MMSAQVSRDKRYIWSMFMTVCYALRIISPQECARVKVDIYSRSRKEIEIPENI